MIARLSGEIVNIADDRIIIDVQGVGYEVFCDQRELLSLRSSLTPNHPTTLHIHTAVSDDAIRLYGFASGQKLRLFRLLLGVERIGPKAALAVMSTAELPTMVRGIRRGDVAAVAAVPGIGRKTAERVILELRDKLDEFSVEVDGIAMEQPTMNAAVASLTALGFRESEARQAVNQVLATAGETADHHAVVSSALRVLDRVPT